MKNQHLNLEHLLTDEQMIDFIINGFILIKPDFREGLNEEICRHFDANGLPGVDFENDPYFEKIFDKAPSLHEVFDHPVVEGAFTSLLGAKRKNFGWFCHALGPNQGGAFWHQDDVNIHHHQVRRLTVMYYPQDVTPDMGPTYAIPGTHFFDTPSDQMATIGNHRRQIALTVPAGTLAITHYDLWHSASRNFSDKMRYMVKLYTDRLEEPSTPTWNHDAQTGDNLARNRFSHENPVLAPSSEEYKLRYLRWQAWQHLKGDVQEAGQVAVPGQSQTRDLAKVQGYIGDPRL